jgi:glyoxylase-like metal-dependent hydrolase (beta-lactamase superfamily II)
MKDYFDSLNVLLRRDDDVYLSGHGPMLREPRDLVRAMLAHRVMRENAIAEKLKDGPASTYTVMDTLYSQVNPRLRRAAERNVLAHLLKMEIEGKVVREGENWRAA